MNPDEIGFCERFVELIIDLEALPSTRRWTNKLMDDCHLVVRCQLANLLQRPEGVLFGQVSFCVNSFYSFRLIQKLKFILQNEYLILKDILNNNLELNITKIYGICFEKIFKCHFISKSKVTLSCN